MPPPTTVAVPRTAMPVNEYLVEKLMTACAPTTIATVLRDDLEDAPVDSVVVHCLHLGTTFEIPVWRRGQLES
eukprot:10335553-Lingulodinium_polyedra.AAC.1